MTLSPPTDTLCVCEAFCRVKDGESEGVSVDGLLITVHLYGEIMSELLEIWYIYIYIYIQDIYIYIQVCVYLKPPGM